MTGLFTAVYDFFTQRRWLLFGVMLLWFSVTAFMAMRITLREDIGDMLPNDDESVRMSEFFKNSKLSDRVIITLSSGSDEITPEILIESSHKIVAAIDSGYREYVEAVDFYKDDELLPEMTNLIRRNLPVFLEEHDYNRLDSLFNTEFGIRNQIASNYRALIGPAGFAVKEQILDDPLGISNTIYKKLERFGDDESVILYDGYYFSEDLKTQILLLHPALPSGETEKNTKFFNGLEKLLHDKNICREGIVSHYFGAPAVAAGNSEQIRSDTSITLSITIVLLLVLFIGFFRSFISPILILIPVASGALFALAVIWLLNGSLSVIAMGAGSLILGIAVNYSLHFMTHMKYHHDSRNAVRSLAFPMTAGSLTTIGGFLCLQFVNSPVLRDLGLYAALSLMGAAFATLVFLPHFAKSVGRQTNLNNNSAPAFSKLIGKLTGSRYIFYGILTITPLMLWFAKDVKFETDMNSVNYMSEDLRNSETYINEFTNRYQKSVFLLSDASDLQTALEQSESLLPFQNNLLQENKILGYTNISVLLPSESEQKKRLQKWRKYWSAKDTADIRKEMIESGKEFKFKANSFDSFSKQINSDYTTINNDDTEFIRKNFFDNLIEHDHGRYTVTGLIRTLPENTSAVYQSLAGAEGITVFDRKLITDKLVEMVGEDFNFITLWTSLIVFFALFIIYGRIELAVISFLPMVFSWIWILGIMSAFDIQFNIINIVLSTLIFALGDDFCIFTADSQLADYSHGSSQVTTTTTSITFSAIATMTGMGALILADHPALSSIAVVSVIGILGVWFMSQVLQPVLFRFLITKPTSKHHQPYTAWGIIKSVFAFSYFTVGSLLITLAGIIILKIIPGKSEKRKLLYHTMMQQFTKSLVYIMGNVKKTIINPNKEDFSKPAVIIANHSSVLDILLTVMLHPKMILLTNKWVWNSPVFGVAIRMAEYYPVAEGAESTITQLEGKIKQGYSIVVFPEGTRSVDGKIGRFHKGAFYLAEKLNIDILPLMIHGAGHTLKKGFFYLNDGRLTLKFLPRIKSHHLHELGDGYREIAKSVSGSFKSQFQAFSKETETTDYFKTQLFSNFIYKGPVLEWYMKIKVRLEDNYRVFNSIVPPNGKIIDLGCGYGFLPYMLALTSNNRTVTGVDYDHEKIAVADNGYLKPANLNFHCGDITTFEFGTADTIIINDVLHYLHPDDQTKVIGNCIHKLNENGILIIRDGVSELKKRHQGTRLTELFSTKLLRFNKTSEHGLHFISSEMIHAEAERHHVTVETVDNTKLTSNIIFILRKKTRHA